MCSELQFIRLIPRPVTKALRNAYSKKQLETLLKQTKLSLIDSIYFGNWSGRSNMLEFQDVVLVKKTSSSR